MAKGIDRHFGQQTIFRRLWLTFRQQINIIDGFG